LVSRLYAAFGWRGLYVPRFFGIVQMIGYLGTLTKDRDGIVWP